MNWPLVALWAGFVCLAAALFGWFRRLSRARLRDEFAAAALPEVIVVTAPRATSYAEVAQHAYEMADAMLAERARRSA